MPRQFKSLEQFRSYAKKVGCRVRKVTVGKKNVYYQAIGTGIGIVGYFNEKPGTGRGFGENDLQLGRGE
jgi:hypothetical protein